MGHNRRFSDCSSRATSDYSIKSEGIPNQDSVEMTIKLLGKKSQVSLNHYPTRARSLQYCLAPMLIGERSDYELRDFPER